ncbi:trypsin-like peptidase domain-containing protein [Streptomyces sp. NBC_00124]|uniref:trypsin-like peptidase domain-containing protein n=1 Tax=Streptomyces sp. NBC_00124 TaxID=2975662 RepID=UPI00225BB9AE|nr:trypsin-like peptidase domain-containing protein [Streptomyces sp. NBC_00124]MCX5357791.1 trypsin-like peptidase domain-containing protein [Streptomyces sp. NBC_00124]
MDHLQQRTGQHRVVEVFGATYGSGYAINDRIVLTARHLLAVDGGMPEPGQPVQVRVAGEEHARRATVAWVSRNVGDAALLSVDGAPWAGYPDIGAARWGYIAEDDGSVPVRARGFPAAQAGTRGGREVREPEAMRGAVEALSASTMRYEIDVQSAVPLLPGDGSSPWSGMSGAALMDARKRILGVVIANRLRYGGERLQAAPVERLFTDPEFVEQVGADASWLEAVTAAEAVPLDARGEQPILQTVPVAPRLTGLSDYELLQARHQAVGFLGREGERRDLRAWCAADEYVSLGLVAGAGGSGKTRLGIHVCRELAAQGWSAGFANDAVLDAFLAAGRVVDVVWPTLLVLDYPDRLTDRTIEWIETLGARRYGPKLRFLLLDRVPGDGDGPVGSARSDLTWWANARRIARSDFIARPRVVVRLRVGGLTGDGRLQHREAARRAFSGGTADLSGLDLTDEAYGNPLKVHVAVLLAIRGEVYPTAADVMTKFLDREMGHWLRRRTEHGIDQVSARLARQVVALATLTKPEIEVVPRLLSAIPDLEDAGGLVRGNVRNWLAELFGAGSHISALEPDLLAEQLLATTPKLPDLVVAVYRHESSTAEHAANMLESLSLAAGNRAGVRDALRNFLAECLGALVAQAAAEPGGRLPGLIEIALNRVLDGGQAEAALAAAAAVVRRVPRREDSYRRLMSRLAKLAIAWCEAQPPHVQTAPVRVDALTDLATEAATALDAAAATALAAEALAVARSLGPDQSRRLARAWYNVGTSQANSGDRPAAREALAVAAALARDGGGADTGVLIERCETLVNLGSCLADLDDQAAALDVCVEAIELRIGRGFTAHVRIGRDFAGHALQPLAGPLAQLASSLRDTPGPQGALGEPRPLRPLAWSEPEHGRWTAEYTFALIMLAARLSTGLAERLAPRIGALPAGEGPANAIAVSDALHGLTKHLSDHALTATLLAESVELRRRFVTDDRSRAEFAKFLSTIAEELDDDDDDDVVDAALAYANESIAEFRQLSPEHFAQYEADLGKAVLAKLGALTQGGMDPLRLTSAQRQWAAAEVEEAAALLRNLPETPENAAVLAGVSAIQGLHLLWRGDVEAAAEAFTEAGERFAVNWDVTEEAVDGLGMMHVLVELLAGRQPYDWLTSMSDAELAELDLDALPLPQQAMLAVAEDLSEGLQMLSGTLAAADRLDVAVGFAHQAVALARFELRVDEDTDPEARNENLLNIGSALAQLSASQLGTPEAAVRSAREAVDVIAPVPAHVEILPLARGMAELALARASLVVDQRADVVGLAESATAELARAVSWFEGDGANFGRWPSMAAMQAEAQTVLANAYLAVNRAAEAIGHAALARAALEQLSPTNPVVAVILTSHLIEGQGEFALGQYDAALAAFDRVIEGYEASDLGASALPGLADAAFMSAVCLQELGQPEPAVQRSRLAAHLWQGSEPAPAVQVRIAANLVVQAMALTVLGDVDDAYRVSLEAITVARAAHAAPSLVSALRVHGQCVTVLGRFAEAVSLFDEALAVALTAGPQVVPPFELGLVHLGLGNCRAELGQLDAALDALLTAAGIFRDIPGQTPMLAGALISAARWHREMGNNRVGLPLVTEAADRCRELIVDEGSAADLADAFTAALWEVVVGHDAEDDGLAADTAAAEGIDFFRTWGLSQRAEVTEATLHYADMLTYHAAFLAEGGHDLEALSFGVEATWILRNLAGLDPDAFLSAYLNSLTGQAELLRNLGRLAEADAAEQEYARWAPS